MRLRTCLIFVLLCGVGPASAQAADFAHETISCARWTMEYFTFAPASSAEDSGRPVLLLLHGAGDRAENFIQAWQSLAHKKKIVLVAPQLPRKLEFEGDAPAVFRCIVDDVKKHTSIDPSRVYIFGHSMGGYLGYDAALLASDYFAAAVIHAMGIEEHYTGIIKQAKRKVPIAIMIGSEDELVSLPMVRKTRDLLRKAQFPIQYREIEGHGHNYYDISGEINNDAWRFLEDKRLP